MIKRKEKMLRMQQREKMIQKWQKRIVLEKGYTETCARWMAERLESLTEYMQYGYALVAFMRQDGNFRLVRATLVYYEQDFHRSYDRNALEGTIIYWDPDERGWRNFVVENFMEWRPIV